MTTNVQEFDLIQRIRVEDGVPRILSTNIRIIEGGDDLLSLAIDILKQLKFYEKFAENAKSQYVGYKLKNPQKGAKRYQLILFRREDYLCIAIPQNILEPHLLRLRQQEYAENLEELKMTSSYWWIRPWYEMVFYKAIQNFTYVEENQEKEENFRASYKTTVNLLYPDEKEELLKSIKESGSAISACDLSSLFPYTMQLLIDSKEVLQECLNYFVKILMEQ
jgi:hypothetical protein